MRVTWRSGLVGLTIALSVSSATAQDVGVVKGNDTGGIIPWSCENEAMARQWAGEFCGSWNKYARITSVYRQYGSYIAFNCLWRPDTARFILPEVRTRSTCIIRADSPRLHPRVRVNY